MELPTLQTEDLSLEGVLVESAIGKLTCNGSPHSSEGQWMSFQQTEET